jgi:hypothetical protein
MSTKPRSLRLTPNPAQNVDYELDQDEVCEFEVIIVDDNLRRICRLIFSC